MSTTLLESVCALVGNAFDEIVLPTEVHSLLTHLATADPIPPGAPPIRGEANPFANDKAGGIAQLNIDNLGPKFTFELTIRTAGAGQAAGFRLDLVPTALDDAHLFTLPGANPAVVTDPDHPTLGDTAATRVSLRVNDGDPVAVRIEGDTDHPARMGVVALDATGSGIVTVAADPNAMRLGGGGFGLWLDNGITLDTSSTAAGPAPAGDPGPAAVPAWQGLSIRGAQLFLPEQTPLIGAGPIPVDLDLGIPSGLYGRTAVHVAETDSHPAFDATVVWDDPGATSLASALPARVEVITSWQPHDTEVPGGAGPIGTVTVAGGDPLRVTGRFTRVPGTDTMQIAVIVEAGGEQGLLEVQGSDTPSKVVVTAAALATAFVADADPPNPATQPKYDGFGATLHALLVAAAGLSAFLRDGSVTVHGVEIDAGFGDPATTLVLRVDYSVDVQIAPIGFGFLSVGMKPGVPMRLRYRNVRLLVDFAQSGLDRFHLSFGQADVGVEDPGGWEITSPSSLKDLFDVVATRSGRGSQWFEIDLRFALNLGPVRVSGTTVRVTLGPGGVLNPEIRGLDASLSMPGLFTGAGKVALGHTATGADGTPAVQADGQPANGPGVGGLDLALQAWIVPLNIGASASLSYADCGGVNKLVFALGVNLPGALPLANTGLGLYGVEGIFGVNATLPTVTGDIEHQLSMKLSDTSIYNCDPGSAVFGIGAVIGTLPDLGYAFSSYAGIVVAVPDLAVRAALDAVVFAERAQVGWGGDAHRAAPGFRLLGLLSLSPEALLIALRGSYTIPHLINIEVPFEAYFPTANSAAWFVRMGSDEIGDRKNPGKIQATLLPDLFNIGGWAFLMLSGKEMLDVGGKLDLYGFSIALGAGFRTQIGPPLVNVDLSASAIVGMGTDPWTLAGHGDIRGRLHLGPVSIGVSAALDLLLAPTLNEAWAHFEVCGEVDLWLTTLRGCVGITVGELSTTAPEPTDWPLQSVTLSDHEYTQVGQAVENEDLPELKTIPTVWPDVIPILQFSVGPANGLTGGPFAAKLTPKWNAMAVGDGKTGNDDLNFTYALTTLDLAEVDPETAAITPVTTPQDAAWQIAKSGYAPANPPTQPPPPDGRPGARELALLTWETNTWTRKLADGAVHAPGKPIDRLASHCTLRATPQRAWALAAAARLLHPGEYWRFDSPPAPTPFISQFFVTTGASWRLPKKLKIPIPDARLPLNSATTGLVPWQYPMRAMQVTTFPAEYGHPLQVFTGGLRLPQALGASHAGDDTKNLQSQLVEVRLLFSVPLVDPVVVFTVPRGEVDERWWVKAGFTARDGIHTEVNPTRTDPGPTDDLLALTYQTGGPCVDVTLRYVAALDVTVLGVQGLSVTANDAAAQSNAADDAASADTAGRVRTLGKKGVKANKTLLKPNTVYRIEVGLSGAGHRRVDGKQSDSQTTTSTRRFWFKTADVPTGQRGSRGVQYTPVDSTAAVEIRRAQTVESIAHYTEFAVPRTVATRTDSFDPTYLQRYIQSWQPIDKSTNWFASDPVAVHFSVDHVADLAAAYKHTLRLVARRTDPDPQQDPPLTMFDLATLFVGAVSKFAAPSDLALLDLVTQGPCPYPVPGASIGGPVLLDPQHQYELFLEFPRTDDPDLRARIPGVVFTTSRYGDPAAMLAALHLSPGPDLPAPHGDLPVDLVAAVPGVQTGDAPLQQALTGLGLERRSPVRTARSTALWCRTGGQWQLHGLLLEAPEPIHRDDTLDLKGFGGRIRVDSLTTGAGASFGTQIRSGTGDRVLFLTTPFISGGPLSLQVTEQDITTGVPGPPTALTYRTAIASAPAWGGN